MCAIIFIGAAAETAAADAAAEGMAIDRRLRRSRTLWKARRGRRRRAVMSARDGVPLGALGGARPLRRAARRMV